MRRARAALTAAVLSCMPWQARAQDMDVPAAVQAALFTKVLTFDRAMETRSGRVIRVVIAYQGRYRASANAMEEMSTALANAHAGNRPLEVIAVDLDRMSLDSVLVHAVPRVLYVAPLRGMDVADIARMARETGTRTYTGVPEYVGRGLSVSARVQGDRPRLLINLAAARAEGAEFSSSLLRLAEISR